MLILAIYIPLKEKHGVSIDDFFFFAKILFIGS